MNPSGAKHKRSRTEPSSFGKRIPSRLWKNSHLGLHSIGSPLKKLRGFARQPWGPVDNRFSSDDLYTAQRPQLLTQSGMVATEQSSSCRYRRFSRLPNVFGSPPEYGPRFSLWRLVNWVKDAGEFSAAAPRNQREKVRTKAASVWRVAQGIRAEGLCDSGRMTSRLELRADSGRESIVQEENKLIQAESQLRRRTTCLLALRPEWLRSPEPRLAAQPQIREAASTRDAAPPRE